MILGTLNRYIARRVFLSIILAFIIVTSVIMLVDFVEGTRNYGSDSNISTLNILTLTALKTPALIEQTIPFVVLFGVMGALYSLNRRSELIVLRASGLSAWRFLSPVVFVSVSLGVIWACVFNPLASRALTVHDRLVETISQQSQTALRGGEVWLREGDDISQTVIYAKSLDLLDRRLNTVTFYVFDISEQGEAQFARRFDAETAVLLQTGYWQLKGVLEHTADGDGKRDSFQSWPTVLGSEDLLSVVQSASLPSFWALPEEIEKTRKAGFSTTELIIQFNRLLSLPLTLIAMTFIAAGVSMHLTREGGTLRLMIFGAALGFAVFFTDSIISAFGKIGVLPVNIAAWTIPFFVLFLGIAYLSKIEDG